MKKTLGTMAAAAILMASTAVAPALAQTTAPSATPAAPNAQTDTTMPATGNGAVAPATGSSAAGTMGAASTSAAAQDYLTQQTETQVSANDYIGQSIYNGEDKSIGNVNDLILEENGGIVAAVVGVGGFLGIGEKNVAVPMSKINISRDADNNNKVRLTTMETAESLKAAPEFKTLDQQQTDNTTTSSTGGAATTTAPAGGATTPSTTPKP
ncbi:Sporulation protein YlmC, PRC-barrel domain family [Rhizobium sp. RU35A]|uniref:PRC-barrel domain-containing protein n=1 Tax=Rhizobium sp. RU35A TaxID=1907414 RepID=UPI0009556E47|nr:PRC-barrel domain-containing protein [Rhizobium sp. RU35A]SIP99251.1 Sporulation protein YlmC, PRC-barrel domain family [Rhizobium sp. RU35A]